MSQPGWGYLSSHVPIELGLMAKVPRHFDRLFEGADGVDDGVSLGRHVVRLFDRTAQFPKTIRCGSGFCPDNKQKLLVLDGCDGCAEITRQAMKSPENSCRGEGQYDKSTGE